MTQQENRRTVIITNEKLEGDLVIPPDAQAIILFAHGSGSSRHSTRNQYVAQVLNHASFATLLIDLLTPQEKQVDEKSRHLRFDINLLARRFESITDWLVREPETRHLDIGYFGSSTGAAAAVITASRLEDGVKAIVCRGGRIDLADANGVLQDIKTPILLIVGDKDAPVIAMNKRALKQFTNASARELVLIPEAAHLFEELGKMEQVAQVAAEWFECYLLKTGKTFVNKYHNAEPKNSGFSNFFKKTRFQIKFKDRTAAGEVLAFMLKKYKQDDKNGLTIIGIPRGGVIVADVIAKSLHADDFDIVIPRKLRAPDNFENAIGAIMQDGSIYLDRSAIESQKISNQYIEMEKLEQQKEIERRTALYRPQPKEYRVKDKTVILVDDGIATGATIIAASRWLRKHKPLRLVIAAPVAPKEVIDYLLKNEADHIEVIRAPTLSKFGSVDQYYADFGPVLAKR